MSGFDLNTVTVSGNLTRAPELRHTTGGTAVCSLRIAHNERFKDASGEWADRAAFFDVTVWSGLGEWVSRNVAKGDKVVIGGRLRWREWGEGDAKRQAVDITAETVIPVPRTSSDAPDQQYAAAAAARPVDDDIPF